MKILLISNMYPSAVSPRYGVFVKNTEELLSKEGVEFTDKAVISGKPSGSIEKLFAYIKLYFDILIKVLFGSAYDLVYLHFPLHTLPIIRLCQLLKSFKLVVNMHGSDLPNDLSSRTKLLNLQRNVFNQSSLIVVPSSGFGELVKHVHKGLETEIYTFPSGGIDLKKFFPKPKPQAKESSGLPASKFIIGYVSSILNAKGWRVFLEALKILKERDIDFHALMLGSGEDSSKRDQELIQLGLSPLVTTIPEITQDKLLDYYCSLDIFVFPSFAESLGLVGLEAMACGIPVIGSNVTGIQSYVIPDKNGFLFNKGNSDELAKWIEHFDNLTDEEKLAMSRNALETAKKYASDKVVVDLAQKLKEVSRS